MALAIAASDAGHEISAVVARRAAAASAAAGRFDGAAALGPGEDLPASDLLVVAVRDDVIGDVARALAPCAGAVRVAVHLSGLRPVADLDALAERGLATGSFHPLQTLPTPEAGAARLAGCWVAVTAPDPGVAGLLGALAASIGAHPFPLADDAKPLYHAAAAAAANYPLACLAMAADLFDEAGVPFAASRPLVEAVVANAFDLGPAAALTGPIARGDVGTVAAQLRAVSSKAPRWRETFAAFGSVVAAIAGRSGQFEEVLGEGR
jgi:predicted short-subunit dehydrogenase-like oxidoreductase (DUF2520 family)